MKRCVVILVRDGDKFLVGRRRDSDKITFPAGHLNRNETPRDGAKRELKEETGLNCKSLECVRVFMPKPGVQIFVFQAETEGKLDFSKDPDKEFSELFFDSLDLDNSEWHIPPKDNLGLKAAKELKA